MEDRKTKTFFKKIGSILKFICFVLIIYLCIIAIVTYNGQINQGKFRVLDYIISSTAEFENTNDYTGAWSYNISQENTLSILVYTGDEHNVNAYLENIECSNENIQIFQVGYEASKVQIKNKPTLRLVSDISSDSSALYEIKVINSNVLKEYKLPSSVTQITHDATIFNIANINMKDLLFNISFTFVIIDSDDNVSHIDINLNLPIGDICANGNIVERQDITNYIFRLDLLDKLKYKFKKIKI